MATEALLADFLREIRDVTLVRKRAEGGHGVRPDSRANTPNTYDHPEYMSEPDDRPEYYDDPPRDDAISDLGSSRDTGGEYGYALLKPS